MDPIRISLQRIHWARLTDLESFFDHIKRMADEFGTSASPKPTNKKLEARKVGVHIDRVFGRQNVSVPILVKNEMTRVNPGRKERFLYEIITEKIYIPMHLPSSNV